MDASSAVRRGIATSAVADSVTFEVKYRPLYAPR